MRVQHNMMAHCSCTCAKHFSFVGCTIHATQICLKALSNAYHSLWVIMSSCKITACLLAFTWVLSVSNQTAIIYSKWQVNSLPCLWCVATQSPKQQHHWCANCLNNHDNVMLSDTLSCIWKLVVSLCTWFTLALHARVIQAWMQVLLIYLTWHTESPVWTA